MSRNWRNREQEFQKQIDHLMNELKANRSKEYISNLYRLRSELNNIIEYKTKGAIVRSRSRWDEEGEKYQVLFERKHPKSYITKVKRNGGGEITDSDEILNTQRSFYSSLYTTPHSTATYETFELFFGGTTFPKLDQSQQDKLEGRLANDECYNVLKQCAKGHYSRSDSLSVEFYLHFWSILSEEMIECFNEGVCMRQV